MDLKHLRTFQVVAQELSFIRASELLRYAQSSVSTQIQLLESELGVKLFERRGKSITLTGSGTRFLTYSKQVLNLIDEAKIVVSDEISPSGTLTIGIFESLSTYRLPPILREYQKNIPM